MLHREFRPQAGDNANSNGTARDSSAFKEKAFVLQDTGGQMT
jgi:hypothetical protein